MRLVVSAGARPAGSPRCCLFFISALNRPIFFRETVLPRASDSVRDEHFNEHLILPPRVTGGSTTPHRSSLETKLPYGYKFPPPPSHTGSATSELLFLILPPPPLSARASCAIAKAVHR